MNKKISSLFLLTVLFSLALVSALNLEVTTPVTLSRSVNSSSFVIKNNEAFALNMTLAVPLTISDGTNSVAISTTSPSTFQLAPSQQITVNLTRGAVPSKFNLGEFSSNIQVNAVDAANSSNNAGPTVPLQFRETFCDYGDIGDIEITRINDETKDNIDEWEWRPLDNIEISVKVYNNLEYDIEAVVEYGLYDLDDKSFVDIGDDTKDVDINSDDYEEVTIEFQVPATSDIDADHSYRFYVKAYDDGNEKKVCTDKKDDTYFEEVDITQESRDVIVSNIEIPDTVSCGESVTVNAKVYNAGKKDEDKIKVTAFNNELGVNFNKEITNFDSGDDTSVSFTFEVPKNLTEKTYVVHFTTKFNYDDNSNTYDETSENFDKEVKVSGSCAQIAPVITDNAQIIPADLDSEAKAGELITVKATIKNIGSASASYIIMTSGIESFATLDRIEPQSLTLDAGKSQEVLIYLKAKDDASGDYDFTIKAVSGTKIKEQTVSLAIQPKTSLFTGFAVFDSLKDNWFIGVIVLINIVLIILIIVVAVRIARK